MGITTSKPKSSITFVSNSSLSPSPGLSTFSAIVNSNSTVASNINSNSTVAPSISSSSSVLNTSSSVSFFSASPASATGSPSSAQKLVATQTVNTTLSSSATDTAASQSSSPSMSTDSATKSVGDNAAPTVPGGTSSVSSTASPASSVGTSSSSARSASSAVTATSKSATSSASSEGVSTSSSDSSSQANGILIPSTTPAASTADSTSKDSNSSSSSGQTSAQNAGPASTSASSTSVEVVTQTFPSLTLTSTSTVTHAPISTLSTPVGITITSSEHTKISFPALVTLVSTSSLANGALTAWTTVVMNPTGAVGAAAANDNSFVDNKGAFGGTLAAVIIVVLAFLAGLLLCCRRRRKRQAKRLQWIQNIQGRLPAQDDLLENPTPVMRSVSQASRNEHYYHPETTSPKTSQPFFDVEGTALRSETRPSNDVPSNSLGLTAMEPAYTSPFSDTPYGLHDENSQIGLAVTTTGGLGHQSRPSLAQSSPSIYPPSLPVQGDGASVFEDIDLQAPVLTPDSHPSETIGLPSPISPTEGGPFDDIYSIKPPSSAVANVGHSPAVIYPLAAAATAPLRPARSVLRETSSKLIDHRLVTPPSSLSGHGHGSVEEQERDEASPSPSDDVPIYQAASSPEQKRHSASKGKEDIFMRRTLLDVRPRLSRDNFQNSGRQ